MKQQTLKSLCCAVLALMLATGCCPGSPARAEEKTVLTVGAYSHRMTMLPFFAWVEAMNPEIEFSFDVFRGANGSEYSTNELEHGRQADIYLTTRNEGKEQATLEHLIDLSALPCLDNVSASVLDSASLEGGVYLLPINMTVTGIAYNKTLLEEWGCELPRTYEDLAALKAKCDENGMVLCKQLSKYPGGGFQVLINVACMCFLNTMEGARWQRDFLAGKDVDYAIWDGTLTYLKKLKELGFLICNEDSYPYSAADEEGLFYRGTLFAITQSAFNPLGGADVTADEFGLMPFISEDGSNNIYLCTPGCYIGLSNTLLEPGNEEKLACALKVAEAYATGTGQAAMNYGSDVFSILKDQPMDPASFLYDAYLAGLDGRAPKQIYTTWNELNLIVEPGNAFLDWCMDRGEEDAVLETLRRCRREAAVNGGAPVRCECAEDLTAEQSARIVGAVYAKLAGTDIALMSLGETHKGDPVTYEVGGISCSIPQLLDNACGVNGTLYQGPVTQEDSWVILPGTYSNTESIAILQLSGKQLRELAEKGFDKDGNGNTYPYVITLKDGFVPEDDEVYDVAAVKGGYTEETGEAGHVRCLDVPDFLNAFTDTLAGFEVLRGDMPLSW